MGGRTDALRESVVLIKQRCRCVYELFIHAAALLFFRFFAVNFYASQLEVFPTTEAK
jgi:hypothetical protein